MTKVNNKNDFTSFRLFRASIQYNNMTLFIQNTNGQLHEL